MFVDEPCVSMNYTPNSVVEGQSLTLCCSSDSRPSTTEIWLDMESRVLSLKYDTDVLCHEIIDITRADIGSYKCFAENEVGTVNDEVIITVSCKFKAIIADKPIVECFSFTKQHSLNRFNMLKMTIGKKDCYLTSKLNKF